MHHVPTIRSIKQHAKSRQPRHLKVQERPERDRLHAQQAAKVLQQALYDLGLPEDLVAQIECRLRSRQELVSKICGVIFPYIRSPHQL